MVAHHPVLLEETIAALAIKKHGIYVDATFGRGGHSQAILEQLGPDGRLIAMDQDPEAIAVAKSAPFDSDARFEIVHASFIELENVLSKRGWLGKVDGVLLDLGVSSPQLDDPLRGFSFMKEGPLDMRMNPTCGIAASDWLQQADAKEIADVLYLYGDERFSRRIAQAIVKTRDTVRITTTTQLAKIIEKAIPKKEKHKHPATRSFQAIRIFINKELEALRAILPQILRAMSVSGRMCIISFHSLEDRLVKQFIQREASGDAFPPDLPIQHHALQQRLKKIGKAFTPSETEIAHNPRARSAHLRVAEKLA